MSIIRSRRCNYIIESNTEDNIDLLKTIPCKYHIFGYANAGDSPIYGKIIFKNPTNIKKLGLLLFGEDILQEQPEANQMEYKQMDQWVEYGIMPTQGRKKKDSDPEPEKKEPVQDLEKKVTEKKLELTLEKKDSEKNELITREQFTAAMFAQQKELCDYLMKQNQTLLEEFKQMKNTSIHNVQTINNIEKIENKTFNINVFLNEECKDAITLTEFINSIKIEDEDLFYAQERGMSDALTYVFDRQLKLFDINTRPVHCTDIKRETVHIKEQNGWIRESGPNAKLLPTAIERLMRKNKHRLSVYAIENKERTEVCHPQYEDWLKMMVNVLGIQDPDFMKRKVLKNIFNSVFLNTSHHHHH